MNKLTQHFDELYKALLDKCAEIPVEHLQDKHATKPNHDYRS